jgi:hypothetical protein
MREENLRNVSTGEPSNWPSDWRKIPNLVDFGVMKQTTAHSIQAEAGFDLSSDHSPVLITMHTIPVPQPRPHTLRTTMNWVTFQNYINGNLTLKDPLKTDWDIEGCASSHIIQQVALSSTTNHHNHYNQNTCAPTLKQKILDKTRLRRRWQHTRYPQYKSNKNKATHELKTLLNNHKQAIQTYLQSLSPMKLLTTPSGKPRNSINDRKRIYA